MLLCLISILLFWCRSTTLKKQLRTTTESGFRLVTIGMSVVLICTLLWKAGRKIGYSSLDQSDKDSDVVEDDDAESEGTEMATA